MGASAAELVVAVVAPPAARMVAGAVAGVVEVVAGVVADNAGARWVQ